MIALGADSVLLGRAFVYALAAAGEAGVANLLDLIDKEMRVAMTLTGAKPLRRSTPDRWSETPESKRLHAFRVGVVAHLADEGPGR